jgi:uncharacterized membrane protein YeaQ/YmgE (transglycosylase-associated protein family)
MKRFAGLPDETVVQVVPSTRSCTMLMSFIIWIVLGLIAGFLASIIVNNRGEGMPLDILLGIAGAVVGGWFFTNMGAAGVTGLNLWSILVSVVGAVAILVVWHAIQGITRHA